MSKSLRHRGPDDEGFFIAYPDKTAIYFGSDTPKDVCESNLMYAPKQHIGSVTQPFQIALLHRRLSIVDVSAQGHQPMPNPTKTVWLSFNGEIYNFKAIRAELQTLGHVFSTVTDTEVILAAYQQWDIDMLHKFNGMWAIAVYDQTKQKVYLIRDRFGVKPLYYTQTKQYFAAASEPKALLQLPDFERKVNSAAVFDFLALGRSETEREGFFKNIKELAPAEIGVYDLHTKHFTTHTYYSLQPNLQWEKWSALKEKQYIEQIREQVREAIRLRMNAAVPIGACLSGGLDSSIILSQMHQIGGVSYSCFTACFENEKYDEQKWAKIMVEATQATWHKDFATAENLRQDLEKLTYHNDEPIQAANMYAHFSLMKLVQQTGIKVTIDGQGADELFGGYPPHLPILAAEALRNGSIQEWYAQVFSDMDSSFGSSKRAITFPLKVKLAQFFPELFKKRYKNSYFEYDCIQNDFWQQHQSQLDFLVTEHPLCLNELLQQQFQGTVLKVLLHSSDRNAMAHSIEARMPFSDDLPLIETLFAIPSVYKIRNGVSKHLLREATKDLLPNPIYSRRDKIGFKPPQTKWLNALTPDFQDYLIPEINDFVNVTKIKQDWGKLLAESHHDNGTKLWRLVQLGVWWKVFMQK